MNKSIIIVAGLIFVGLGLVLAYVFINPLHHSDSAHDMHVPSGMHRMPDGSLMSNETTNHDMEMMGGMDHSAMMVKSERAFLEGMIPHHQEAVDTAREVAARGGSTPEIKKLAEDIIVAQEKEIAMMKEWYRDWYGTEYVEDKDAYTPMMRDLSSLSGAALDAVFLEDMIMHHMGAIMMAESVQSYIENEEITTLTTTIIETQMVEIQLMRTFLAELQ